MAARDQREIVALRATSCGLALGIQAREPLLMVFEPHTPSRGLSRAPLALAFAGALAAAACSSEPTVTLAVVGGLEADVWTAEPPVTEVEITAVDFEGEVVGSVRVGPGESFDLGVLPAESPLRLEVTGRTSEGATVVRGRSVSVALAGLAGELPVFAQRVDGFARMASLARAHDGGAAGVLAERYLFTTGGASVVGEAGQGDPRESDSLDMLGLVPAVGGALPVAAESLVARSPEMMLFASEGAVLVDFEAGASSALTLPAGLSSFGELAGGLVVDASDGRSFVVAATRADAARSVVLEVGPTGALAARSLVAPRAGAAAAWIEGVGLVVAGGSDTAPGVEVLGLEATAFAALPYAPDATRGGALVPTGATAEAALVGGALPDGTAPATRRLALVCSTCAPVELGSATLPALARGRAFLLPSGEVFVLGDDATLPAPSGLLRAFRVSLAGAGEALELPLRVPRAGALPLASPNGTLAILGGRTPSGEPALAVESFFP
jgi:hypothetical protein